MAGKIIRTFSVSPREVEMLEAIARYHDLSKSAMITSLVKREFWRVFPAGTAQIRPDRGARIERSGDPA